MSIDRAQEQLQGFIETYQSLSEREKFSLGKVFNDATGGKLSPFNSPSPVSIGVVPVIGPDGKIGFLGVRHAIPPFVGQIALAGGFLSPNEDPIAGAVREILEETGIGVDSKTFAAVHLPMMAHNNNLLLFFKSTSPLSYETILAANANLKNLDGEASEVVLITPETPVCFPLHQQVINDAFVSYGVAPGVVVSKSFRP